ncbi:MAG: hypothetical protein QF645_10255 [Planctomycetota bacterium]|nr:hypothetical protein [Planctomycetota bacterium]
MKNIIRDLVAGVAFGVTTLLFSGAIVWASLPEKPSAPRTEEAVYKYLQQQRENQIKTLQEYVKQGAFPFGKEGALDLSKEDPHFDPNQPLTHRILGPNGVLCALAHLISKSGHEDLVNRLAEKENHFCVGKDHNQNVEKWILTSGLTREECIQIQMPAMGGPERRITIAPVAPTEEDNQRFILNHLLTILRTFKKNSDESLKIAAKRYLETKS